MQSTTSQLTPAGHIPGVGSSGWLGSVLLLVDAGVRYWEDATVNGTEDADGTLIPHRCGERWQITIELATGRIKYWPQGTKADVHYKVCDDGEYWLADEAGRRVAKWKGDYVPDRLLCVGDRGYGDYIIFKVGPDGVIDGWRKPEIDESDWLALPNNKISNAGTKTD
jgi:hypothetical protein